MNKLFRVAVCVLAMAALSTARAHAQGIGFKIGSTFSSMDADPEQAGDRWTVKAFGAGGFIRFGMGSSRALQIEALSVTKGSRIVNESALTDVSAKFDYIEVPVTLMIAVGNGPYMFVGPSFAFETGCEVDLILGADEVKSEGDCDTLFGETEFKHKKLEVSATGGLGFQFGMGPGLVLIEGRYTHGFTDINDSGSADGMKLRNRSLGLFAGYSIALKQ